MTIFFDNCTGQCSNAIIELPDGTPITKVIDACIAKFGEGSLMRANKELLWKHDIDAPWIGCCAEKVYGRKP